MSFPKLISKLQAYSEVSLNLKILLDFIWIAEKFLRGRWLAVSKHCLQHGFFAKRVEIGCLNFQKVE